MNRILTLIQENWIACTLVSLAAITVSSLWPFDQLPMVPGSDKLHHTIAYAVLMFPVALRKPDRWILFALFFIAYSGGIELVQPYVNRYGEWLDLLANSLGVVFGFVIAELVLFFSPVALTGARK
ncbi:MAG: VanZ family protein [Pseudomonadales bacterium]|jgi:hypothetical protein|nr:VanZ family protein [Pseudomonadales bacterium]